MKENILKISDRLIFYSMAFVIFFLPIYNSLTSFGIGLAIFSLMITFFLCWDARRLTSLSLPIYAFLSLSLLSLGNTVDLKESLIGLRKLIMCIFLYLAVVNSVTTDKRLKYIIFILILSASLVSLDGLYQLMSGRDLFSARTLMVYPHLGIKRITASFQQAGSLGIYLGVVIPLAMTLELFYLDGLKRLLIGGMCIVMLAALILTFVPGAVFGVYMALSTIFLIKKKKLLFLLLLLGFVLGFFLLPPSLTNWSSGAFFLTFKGRLKMWEIALKMIKMHPLMGLGLHTFPLNYEKYCPPGYPFYGLGTPYAHNMYVHMATEIGLLGVVSFFILIFALFKNSMAAYKKAKEEYQKVCLLGLLGAMVAFLVHGILESSLYTSQGAILFWILLGLTVSLCNIINKKSLYLATPPQTEKSIYL